MDKIVNYVKNGRGAGLLFLLAASVLLTLMLMFFVKDYYAAIRPQILLVADELLPITVEDGKIVEPAETYKEIAVSFSDDGNSSGTIPIVLDTRTEDQSIPGGKQGLFIMKDMIYAVSTNKIQRYDIRQVLPEDGILDKVKFEAMLDSFSGMFSVIVSVLLIALFFIILLFKAVIVSFLGEIFLKISKKENLFDFAALMRGTSVIVAFLETVSYVLIFYANIDISGWHRFLLELAVLFVFLYNEKKAAA